MTAAKTFSVNEYCSWILCQNSPHNGIIVFRVEGNINFKRLKEAVKIISIYQSQLRYSISPDICGFTSTNNSVMINEIYLDVDWRVIVENELAKPFLKHDALARMTVLKTKTAQYIIFCFHHIIADGTSSIDFLFRILHFYNYLKLQNSSVLQNEKKEFIQPTPESRVLALQACPPISKTKIKGMHITKELINKVEGDAKASGYTLNTYLSALILESASQAFRIDQFNASMSVDLRKKNTDHVILPLKFHTSWIDFAWEKSDTPKTIHTKIRDAFRNRRHVKNLIDLNELINQRKNDNDFAKLFIASKPSISISYNNKVDNADIEDAALKVVELHSSVNCQAYLGANYSFAAQLCHLSQHGLFMNINYPDAWVDEKEINFFLICFEEKLKSWL